MDEKSSSAFVDVAAYSAEWTDVTQLQRRSHNVLYTASRYGRRFVLKGLTDESARLSDFRLAQEKEFRLGISVSHPHIAATYGLENVPGAGRCIVQEYIDGVPLAEWLATKPSLQARERVLDQLLDTIDYLHQHQMVHHDLKSGNILITRNGQNVKLIDFGLSDTDDSLSPCANDPQADIQALKRIIRLIFPHRYILLSGNLQRSIHRQRRLRRLVPMLITLILFAASVSLFVIVRQEKKAEQQRYEALVALIDKYMAQEREELLPIINRRERYDKNNVSEATEYSVCLQDYAQCTLRYNALRDSLTALYDEDDPLREQFWQIWVRREAEMNNELIPMLSSKLQ